MTLILEDVIEEHAEEAAFLWQQREEAVRAPDFDIEDIMEADERVEAHLDGLRIAGQTGWEVTRDIGFDLGGEYFTGMWLAVEHGNTEWIKEVMQAAEGDAEATRGVISAFGWTSGRKLQGLVKQLLATSNPFGRQIGIGACAIHRVNPGSVLEDAVNDPHPGLRARALKAAAELYANGEDLKHPELSPVYGDFSGFPPTYIVTGTRDMFLSDSARTHRALRTAGVVADLNVYEGVSHAEYAFLTNSPEFRQTYAELVAFLAEHLN